MTSRDFCYWIQGLFELGAPKTLDELQTDLIRRHLAMVFIHEIDPSMGGPEHQQKLTEAHRDNKVADAVAADIEKALRDPLDLPLAPKFSQTELDHLAEEGRELGRELARKMQQQDRGLTYTRDPQFNC